MALWPSKEGTTVTGVSFGRLNGRGLPIPQVGWNQQWFLGA
jgi:hypothetical protein